MNIVCAWELGTNLGHLTRLRGLAEVLDTAGHGLSLVLADLSRASLMFNQQRVRLFQAPLYRQKLRLNRHLASLADVLTLYGYNTRESLEGLVCGWESLLKLSGAELLIADHAPTAQLAARRLGLPVVIIGNGFTLPQAGQPLPDWRPGPQQDNVVADQERFVLRQINALLPAAEQLTGLGELYRCHRVLIDSFPLIDPQRAVRRNTGYCAGRFNPSVSGQEQWFRGAGGDRVGVYLHPSYGGLREAGAALARLDAEVVLLCPEAREDILASLQQFARLRVIPRFVDMAALMQDCDWFVSHGGLGTATLCLRQGKPQVILPTQMEQLNTGAQLQGAGLAHLIPLLDSVEAYERAFRGSRPDAAMRARAAAFPGENRACIQLSLPEAVLETLGAFSAPHAPPAGSPSRP